MKRRAQGPYLKSSFASWWYSSENRLILCFRANESELLTSHHTFSQPPPKILTTNEFSIKKIFALDVANRFLVMKQIAVYPENFSKILAAYYNSEDGILLCSRLNSIIYPHCIKSQTYQEVSKTYI